MGRPNELGIPTSTSGHVMSDLSMFKMQKPMKFHRPTDSGCVVDVVGISRRQHRSLQRQLVGFVQPIYSLFLLFVTTIVNEKITNILDDLMIMI